MKPSVRSMLAAVLALLLLIGIVVLFQFERPGASQGTTVPGELPPAPMPVGDAPSIEEEIDEALQAAQAAAATKTRDGEGPVAYSNTSARDAEDLRGEYAAAYNRARTRKLMQIDHCEGCGRTASQLKRTAETSHLETHHVISVLRIFNEDRDPGLISDEKNLIVLCRNSRYNCHWTIGHDPDGPRGPSNPDWKKSNPHVRRDAASRLNSLGR